MNYKKRYSAMQYKVIKPSDNGAFQVGDKIVFTGRGDIINSSGIWVDNSEVDIAIRGWEIERDYEVERKFNEYCVRNGLIQSDTTKNDNQMGLL